jgi:hypothetical protein
VFYFHADVTIQSPLTLRELADQISGVLAVPPMKLDDSGRYEGDEVYQTRCFGLIFELAQDDPPLTSFHLAVNSNVDKFDFDGSEREVDGLTYLRSLLRGAGIDAAVRDPKLLYGG